MHLRSLFLDTDAIPVITGPTAVGKTAVSLALAEGRDAEIISVDSRQIYRELTIGTAKPSAEELARVPHHFIHERSLPESYSAGTFASEAAQRMAEITDRGRRPIVVGGSTLYLHALLFGLADIPSVDTSVRDRIEKRLLREGPERLYKELERLDPDFARTLDPTKTQRLVRGLEVAVGTGRPLSSYFRETTPTPYVFDVVVLSRDRPELYARINRRVDRMLENGLVEETRDILSRGIDPACTPLRTIGYREATAYLQGTIDREEMRRLIKRNTRRYAKRQFTWFRRYDSFRWVNLAKLQ